MIEDLTQEQRELYDHCIPNFHLYHYRLCVNIISYSKLIKIKEWADEFGMKIQPNPYQNPYHPTEYFFQTAEDAMAFKLTWIN